MIDYPNHTESLLRLFIYNNNSFCGLKNAIEPLPASDKTNLLLGQLEEIPIIEPIQRTCFQILRANLINYAPLTSLYYSLPEEHYILQQVWTEKIDVYYLSKIEDKIIQLDIISKLIKFYCDEHQKSFLDKLSNMKHMDEKNPIKALFAQIRAWMKDETFKTLGTYSAITLKAALAITQTPDFFIGLNSCLLTTFAVETQRILSSSDLYKIISDNDPEIVKIIQNINANGHGQVSDKAHDLKIWVKYFQAFMKNFRKNISSDVFKSTILDIINIANWSFIVANLFENTKAYHFLKQAREGLAEKKQHLDQIEEKLDKLEKSIVDSFGSNDPKKIFDTHVQLIEIEKELKAIISWISAQIVEAEKRNQLQRIFSIVGSVLGVASGSMSLFASGLMFKFGVAGTVVGIGIVSWNCSNIYELKEVIKNLKQSINKANDLLQMGQTLMNDLAPHFNMIDNLVREFSSDPASLALRRCPRRSINFEY